MKGRTAKQVIHETLPVVAGFGLTCLPAPSPGDMFLDLEGDPFIGQGGHRVFVWLCFSRSRWFGDIYGRLGLFTHQRKGSI